MNRDALLARVTSQPTGFDLIVIGGGATGAGIAWDAASRGLSTLLLERGDFGQGTSSKSTKLIHGGVRYLAQGQLALVREGLQERRLLLENAPSHVRPLQFLVPLEGWFERIKYHAGLGLYDLLARSKLPARYLSAAALRAGASNLQPRFDGAMSYSDAQFDDTRLLLAVLSQAVAHRALVVNYAEVTGFGKRGDGRLAAVILRDRETGKEYEVEGRIIINATGPAVAATASLDRPDSAPIVTLSRGSHVVVGREFWPADAALLMPHTPDNRVMFAIPWHHQVLLGTTDVMVEPATLGSTAVISASPDEIDFILEVAGHYLEHAPKLGDVRACFAGVRALAGGTGHATAAQVSREYQITASRTGLITVSGGKWTTFRRMAEACVDYALRREGLQATKSTTSRETFSTSLNLGPDPCDAEPAPSADNNPALVAGLFYRWHDAVRAIRVEMARHVEDILARRTRALFLDAAGACAVAPAVAKLLAQELGHDARWIAAELDAFERAAAGYRLPHQLQG